MLFYRDALLKGQAGIHTAPVTSSAPSGLVARSIVLGRHTANRTSALLRSGRWRRAYSTVKGTPQHPPTPGPGFETTTQGFSGAKGPLFRRLLSAWNDTPTKWYPLPLAVGALLLVVIQYRKKAARAQKEVHVNDEGLEIIKLKGPWQVHVVGALPLRSLSRLWGYANSFELPVWFRPYGFKMYAYAFGCNLDEMEEKDLTKYSSLGDFFYRKLEPGARPVADAALVSPADGTVLHFGTIKDLRVEQVKGITYSLDALLGVDRSTTKATEIQRQADMPVVDDHEFANVNGIEYSLDRLLGRSTSTSSASSSGSSTPVSTPATSPGTSSPGEPADPKPVKHGKSVDASVEADTNVQETLAHDASVALEMGLRPSLGERKRSTSGTDVKEGNALFFTVIYLAPGDYHRFHSPTAWVVEKRRHFVGELYSVSPYMAKRLENLFVLNERVALLGRWKHGFFGMVPVGATNVGSILINFDQDLRTNRRGRPPPPGTYTEGIYSNASTILNGQPLAPAQEMGGFRLGSTIVLVFEAPADFEFKITAGQKIKVGQPVGDLPKQKSE